MIVPLASSSHRPRALCLQHLRPLVDGILPARAQFIRRLDAEPAGDRADTGSHLFRHSVMPEHLVMDLRVCAQLLVKPDQLTERFDDNPEVRARGRAKLPRVMADPDFVDSHPKRVRLREDLGIHHRADGADLNAVKNRTLKDFKGAIDVAHFHAEDHAHQHLPAEGVDEAVRWILPFAAVTGDDVVMARVIDQIFELLQIELPVRISEENEIMP